MRPPPIVWPRVAPAWSILAVLAGLFPSLLSARPAFAKGNYADLKPVPVVVMLGDAKNQMRFFPDQLKFETGRLYKLLLVNDSPVTHEFVSSALSDAVFTVKTEVVSPEGEEIAEIAGVIREIEIAPRTTVEWYFVPLRTVAAAPFVCDQPGHLAAGMKGQVTIE